MSFGLNFKFKFIKRWVLQITLTKQLMLWLQNFNLKNEVGMIWRYRILYTKTNLFLLEVTMRFSLSHHLNFTFGANV